MIFITSEGEEKIKTTVRVNRHLWGLLRAKATEENTSLSAALEEILRKYFEEERPEELS